MADEKRHSIFDEYKADGTVEAHKATVPTERKILRDAGDVALVEETTSLLIPEIRINTAYVVTSSRIPEGAYFDNLPDAIEEFEREVGRSNPY